MTSLLLMIDLVSEDLNSTDNRTGERDVKKDWALVEGCCSTNIFVTSLPKINGDLTRAHIEKWVTSAS
jgi:hypothetical protein